MTTNDPHIDDPSRTLHLLDGRRELLDAMAARAGGVVKAAQLLGVSYNGSMAKWRKSPNTLPLYVERSILAHLLLTDARFDALVRVLEAESNTGRSSP